MKQARPKIKICGLQPGDDLNFTANPNIAYIGIIYVQKSRRYVSPVASADIVNQSQCPVVGVFSDATIEDILAVRNVSGIQIAQLHGNESETDCEALKNAGMTVWKAVQVPGNDVAIDHVKSEIQRFAPVSDAVLLDAMPSPNAVVTGGHGQTFDWRILRELTDDLEGLHWWIAGGINPENVSSLLANCRPSGMDVSSGVETNGRKNWDRISKLIGAVNQA